MRRALVLLLVLLALPAIARAELRLSAQGPVVTVEWDRNPDLDPGVPPTQGYFVSYGTSSRLYATEIHAGNTTSHVLTLPTGTYFFAVQAYNENGRSAYSNEVSAVIGAPDPVPAPGPQGAPAITLGLPSLPINPTRINFQPASASAIADYLADTGLVFGDRGNGRSYGWVADVSAHTRIRNAAISPDARYDRLVHLQKPENPDAVWELALPNGTYDVRIVAGDPGFFDIVAAIQAEGVVIVRGATSAGAPWVEGTGLVTVSDGRLTIRSAPGAVNNKLCFLDITPR